jgi:hypothetical protein
MAMPGAVQAHPQDTTTVAGEPGAAGAAHRVQLPDRLHPLPADRQAAQA